MGVPQILAQKIIWVVVVVIVVVLCRVPAANAPRYTAACRLIVKPLVLDVPTCTARCLSRHNDARDPSSERWNYWVRNGR